MKRIDRPLLKSLFRAGHCRPVFFLALAALAAAAACYSSDYRRTMKANVSLLSDLSDKLIEIHHQESVGDDNHHAAMSRLFDGSIEALEVLKWKELYDLIEDTIDGCEDVCNTLERIVLKNG